MSTKFTREKHPEEVWDIEFDVTDFVPVGETISTAVFEPVVLSGTDASPGGMLSGNSVINGGKVKQRVIGGVVGVTYLFNLKLTFSNGAIDFVKIGIVVANTKIKA